MAINSLVYTLEELPACTHLCLLEFKINVLSVHDVQQNLESDDKVRVDDGPRLVTFFFREASTVYDSHLLYDR